MINRVKELDEEIEELEVDIDFTKEIIREKEEELQEIKQQKEKMLSDKCLTFEEENYVLEYQMELERERKLNGQ